MILTMELDTKPTYKYTISRYDPVYMRWCQLKNQMRKYPHTNGIKKAKGKRRMQIRIQITINITENKRTCMMGLSLLLLKPN